MDAITHLTVAPKLVDEGKHSSIANLLEQIEWEHNCDILYACESGSRAWGFASQDSDYDVRFIYKRNASDYLSIGKTRDVIERPISDEFDLSGWDLPKTLGLLRNSNPSLLEWLHSPVIYRKSGAFYKDIVALASEAIRTSSLYWHYYSMAKNNNERNGIAKHKPLIKRYLYVLRPLLCAKWIERYNSIPPVLFDELVLGTVNDDRVFHEIEQLVAIKALGTEQDRFKPSDHLDRFMAKTALSLEKYRPTKGALMAIDKFDNLLQKQLAI